MGIVGFYHCLAVRPLVPCFLLDRLWRALVARAAEIFFMLHYPESVSVTSNEINLKVTFDLWKKRIVSC